MPTPQGIHDRGPSRHRHSPSEIDWHENSQSQKRIDCASRTIERAGETRLRDRHTGRFANTSKFFSIGRIQFKVFIQEPLLFKTRTAFSKGSQNRINNILLFAYAKTQGAEVVKRNSIDLQTQLILPPIPRGHCLQTLLYRIKI